MRILIVDDRPSNLKLLRAILEADGAIVSEAADGVEAIGALKRMGFDAIISDILMPRMDGYRLCMEVRGNPQSCDVPFIAYTATYTSQGDEKLMLEIGADRFLRKPASAALLSWTVREVVQARRRPPSSARPRPRAELLTECNQQLMGKLEEKTVELATKTERLTDSGAEALKSESRRALHYAVTAALSEEAPPATINERILGLIGCGLQVDLGEWWNADRGAKLLRCTDTWHLSPAEFGEFATASRNLALARDEDLAGRVWRSGKVEWCADLMQDGVGARRDEACRLGLRGWIGFPVKLRQKVVGVIGFFGRKVTRPDVELVALFDAMGLQLGQFAENQFLTNQLRQTQKMASLGTLTAGIAHDFNSSLVAIYNYCELARIEAKGNALLNEQLDGLIGGAKYAAALARRILAAVGNEKEERLPVELRQVVTDAMRLLRSAVPIRIEIQTSLAADAPVILADATQVHRVLMNIGINAMHAMPGQGGRLTVILENCRVDAELAGSHPYLHAGPYARLTLRDNGHGMDEETLDRIFEPFFTTKAPGEGTGLGLAVVLDIVKSHGGAVTVSSRIGEGTSFQVYFPAYAAQGPEAAAAEPDQLGQSGGPKGAFGQRFPNRIGYRTAG